VSEFLTVEGRPAKTTPPPASGDSTSQTDNTIASANLNGISALIRRFGASPCGAS
jgi:hypothetical protein